MNDVGLPLSVTSTAVEAGGLSGRCLLEVDFYTLSFNASDCFDFMLLSEKKTNRMGDVP